MHLRDRTRRTSPAEENDGRGDDRTAWGRLRGRLRARSHLRGGSVAREVFLLQLVLVVLLVVAGVVAMVAQIRRDTMADARHRTLAAAESFAHAPGLLAALNSPDPSARLQPLAAAASAASGVDAIIVYGPDGVVITHSDPKLIGKHVIGPYAQAAQGKPFTSTFNGALGLSVISGVPVKDAHGSVVAIVAAPVTVEKVHNSVNRQLPLFLLGAAGALVLASVGTGLVSRRLRRRTHGLGPVQMTRMFEHHDAVLHAVREGVLIVSPDGRLLLVNDEARRLLALPAEAEGLSVAGLGLDPRTTNLLLSDRDATDEVHLAADRLLSLNKRSTSPFGGRNGSVVTLRDTTELEEVSGRAEVARDRLKLLYDAGVRIGTTLDVATTAQELAEVATPRFADVVTVELLEPVLSGQEPDGTSTDLRRAALAGMGEEHPLYAVGTPIRFVDSTPMAAGLKRGEPVMEPYLAHSFGWREQDPERARKIIDSGIHSLLVVPIRARGVLLGLADFWRSGTSPVFAEEDLSFAEELVSRAAVCIDNARRYTREHSMAVTLQHSLLPRGIPEQPALEVAYRYLPAEAGVGGDWFDVIPLPGARVALVVGDVVGHGLHAAATMGRLRTAVHNFSALDLSPDELLGRLDELVEQIDIQDEATDSGRPVIGATCLYVIYDAVSGLVTAAAAGHLPPAAVHPDGTVTLLRPPISAPLGLSAGVPFETAELTLPEGSSLVLYTDGLIEDRHRDLDQGLDLLCRTLSGPARTPEDVCVTLTDALLPSQPGDDVALLVARTRRLDPAHVAEWEVPSDPAAVGPVRRDCARKLAQWGLEEISFATELILSELVTNAIRYGAEPIRVRLVLDRTLVCEVFDGSSTSPHIRRAKATDEGGRGLFLVARFAERWGTRYSARGKTIWSVQAIDHGKGIVEDDMGELLLGQWDDEDL
ncbi:SpoIIE family protein phosphatase [Streptomyces sp. NPDC051976]|uniref:SpoIIE family protein phosphatase n=1 Tax=Streptomyces sp. NPDC051976 TaxID=3154947 RepID=UPI00342C53D5